MRRILLRLLLLAVFFNTAVGMPLHEAEHLLQTGPEVAQEWRSLDAGVSDSDDGHESEAQAPCSWCVAFAQQAGALWAPPIYLASWTEPAAPQATRPAAAFVPDPERWPFASRDPPVLA
ncbi:DUF2946 family protein [Variovorax sp. Root318D1]|uniref:DUF2946 family protein n=1 Tax=Variovorax sp. Root318D1 TaxID=1736513 RepID=UPI001F1D3A64|nr:DUF2946 family protein [Variovorax sp. Root318D1]